MGTIVLLNPNHNREAPVMAPRMNVMNSFMVVGDWIACPEVSSQD
jgi:hypothetical protein